MSKRASLWEWIEAIIMFLGFLYIICVMIIVAILMLPILILFERTEKSIGKLNGKETT